MTSKTGAMIAPGYVKTAGSTTEYQLWDTTGGIYFGGVKATPPSTAAFTLVDQATVQTIRNKTLGPGTAWGTESGTTSVNLSNSGLSLIPYTTAANTFTLDAPAIGSDKFISITPTTVVADTTAIYMAVYSGSTAIFFMNATAYTPYLYIGLLPPSGAVHLLGVSTAQWNILSANPSGSVKFSTSATFSS